MIGRALVLALLGCSSSSAWLVQRALPSHAQRGATVRMLLPTPPAPPATRARTGSSGGDDDLVLAQLDRASWAALLSVWLWQTEQPGLECGITVPRELIRWDGDMQTSALSWMRGEVRAAQLGGETIGLVFVRYELDKSSFTRLLSGGHVMVIDAIITTPSLPSSLHAVAAKEGIRNTIMELCACRGMRAEFCPRFLLGVDA